MITVQVCFHSNYKIWYNQTAERTFTVTEMPSFNTKKNYKLEGGEGSTNADSLQ